MCRDGRHVRRVAGGMSMNSFLTVATLLHALTHMRAVYPWEASEPHLQRGAGTLECGCA